MGFIYSLLVISVRFEFELLLEFISANLKFCPLITYEPKNGTRTFSFQSNYPPPKLIQLPLLPQKAYMLTMGNLHKLKSLYGDMAGVYQPMIYSDFNFVLF